MRRNRRQNQSSSTSHRVPTNLLLIAGITCGLSAAAHAQLSLTTTTASQNFDSLPSTGTGLTQSGGIFSLGWSFLEGAANANGSFITGTGSSNAGDTYSFGVAGTHAVGERALGMLQSGNLTSILGFKFTNNTGATISSLAVGYTGEEWRLATAADSLAFSYQTADVALNAGTGWTGVTGLGFTTPVTGSAAAVDGNATANHTAESATINGLSIAPGTTVTFRWVDGTAGSSAGMAIDDFSLTATLVQPLYWDPFGTSGIGGTGVWDTTSGSWSTSSAGQSPGTTFASADPAIFGGTGAAVGVDSGGIAANAGIEFDVGGYTINGPGAITLGSSPNITITNAADTATFTTQLSGSNGLIKAGSGDLVLTNTSNNFSGSVQLNSGTLQIDNDSELGSTSNTLSLNGGALRTTANVSLASTRTTNGTGLLSADTLTTMTFLGPVSAGGITLSGAGSVEFANAANSVSGLTFSSAGTLNLSGSDLTITGNATTTFSAGSAIVTNHALSFSAATGTMSVATGGTLEVPAIKFPSAFQKIGSGTLLLDGDTTGGSIRLGAGGTSPPADGGYLVIQTSGGLGTNTFDFNNGTLEVGSTMSVSNALSVGGGSLNGGAAIEGGNLTVAGDVSFFGTSALIHKITVNNNTTFSGNLQAAGSSSGGVILAGSGTLVLAGAANVYEKTITVNGPTVVMSGAFTSAGGALALTSGAIRGNGTASGITASGGTIQPGSLASVGQLTSIKNVTLSTGATLTMRIGGAGNDAGAGGGVDYDQIIVSGSGVVFTPGDATLNVLPLTTLASTSTPATYAVVKAVTGASVDLTTFFHGLSNHGVVHAANSFTYSVDATSSEIDITVTSTPEPGAASLLLISCGGFLVRRNRRRSAQDR